MQEKSIIKKNILRFLEYKGVSKYKFYQITSITRGVLDQNNGMSEDNTARFIAFYPEIDLEWLLTGKGNMLKDVANNTVNKVSDAVANTAEASLYTKENGGNEVIELLKDKITLLEETKDEAIKSKNEVIAMQAKDIQRLESENNLLKLKNERLKNKSKEDQGGSKPSVEHVSKSNSDQ